MRQAGSNSIDVARTHDHEPSPSIAIATVKAQAHGFVSPNTRPLSMILKGLSAHGEEGRQVEALTQLCEMLSMETEESLSTLSVSSFVPELVRLLNHESNRDIMLLAARALTYLCDVLPSSGAAVMRNDGISCLYKRMLTIEYMDLAEQCLQALTRIAEAFASSVSLSWDKLDEPCSHDVVTQFVSLISTSNSGGGQASLSSPTFTGLIRLLSACASGSPLAAKTLLLLGISGVLKDILATSGISANTSVSRALSRPPEQIFEIVNLANELLPPLPQDTISTSLSLTGNVPEVSAREKLLNFLVIKEKKKLLNEQPELLKQFGMDLLPILIQICGSSVNGPVRHKCLSVIGKLMYFSNAETIQPLLSAANISSFLAGVLACEDPHVLVLARQIAEILMEKLPEIFSNMFVREGVVHAVDQLSLAANPNIVPSQASSTVKDDKKLNKILLGLRADGGDRRQVEALTQLCKMLSLETEELLSTFSVDSFVPVLVGLLNHESNQDIMLLAAWALAHLCDVLPSSCAAVVHYGAVSCFCSRLLKMEYSMDFKNDFTEQSLQALEKISQEHPTACLRAGALKAVLLYLEFFSIGFQRVAISTAANICKNLPSDAADFVIKAIPKLMFPLFYADSKVNEQATVCLTRITEVFASSPDKLDEPCNCDVVARAALSINCNLSTPAYTCLIRFLSTCASGSTLVAKTLLLKRIGNNLKDILADSVITANASTSLALSRPPEQIFEIVNLANELLPPLPQRTISHPTVSSNLFVEGSVTKNSPASSSGKQEDTNGNVHDVSPREKLLNDQPELLQQFGMDLLPVLIQTYGSNETGPAVRHKCLSVIGKLMYFSNAEMIQSLLNVTNNISSFFAGVLACEDPHILVPALQIAESLMEKLPGTFSDMFVREGVVHAVDQLIILAGNPITLPTQPSSADNKK